MQTYSQLLERARAGHIVAVVFLADFVYQGFYVPGDDRFSKKLMKMAHHDDGSVRAGLLIQMCQGIREEIDRR